jgi:Group II intron, maturase-specific domain
MAYFRLADTGNLAREVDRCLRRRLRQVRWKEWKTTAARRHNLRIRGISERNVRKWGGSSKGYRRIAGSQVLGVALPNTYWEHLSLKTLTATRKRFQSDGLTNRRMRARMSGGVGGGGAPSPTRFQERLNSATRPTCMSLTVLCRSAASRTTWSYAPMPDGRALGRLPLREHARLTALLPGARWHAVGGSQDR